MEIKTKELARVFNLIIKQLQKEQIESITFDTDLYLEVLYENFMEIDKEATNNDVGSIQDDWHILQTSVVNGQIIDSNDYNRIGNILKAIGQRIDVLCHV